MAQMLTCLDDLSSLYPREPQGPQQQEGEEEGGREQQAGGTDSIGALLEGKHVVVIGEAPLLACVCAATGLGVSSGAA